MSLKKTADFSYVKHKGVPLEDIELDEVTYAISINYEKQPDKIDKACVYKYYRQVYDSLYKFRESIDIILYIEASPTGRLHFHGYLQIKDYIGYIEFLNDLKQYSSFEIDTITEPEVWFEYCRKQEEIWREYMDKHICGYPMEISKDQSLKDLGVTHRRL